jgi:hypothetical protein
MSDARPSAPPRTDPLAAALAFAIREAVRLEAERPNLSTAPDRANVSGMDAETEKANTPGAAAA